MERIDRTYLVAGAASLLLSLLAIWQAGIINHDGVLYLRAIDGDAESIRRIGNWLFYSKLIGWLSAGTGLGPEQAAYALNTLLDLLLVLAFVRFVEELGGDHTTLAWAAILILVLPYLNGNRAEIIRDHGYWAFTLVAMTFYLKLFRTFSWKWLLLWNLGMGVATLFRVEGLAFLLFMPLGLLLRPVALARRLGEAARCLLPVLLVLGLLLAWHLLAGGAENRLTRLAANSRELLDIFTSHIPGKAEKLQHRVLPDLSTGTATFTIYFAILVSIAKDLAESLSWPLALVILFHRRIALPTLPRDYPGILAVYGIISLAVLLIQAGQHFVMVSRYTMALALMLLPIAVFTLDQLWRNRRSEKTWLARAMVLVVIGLAADSLINSPGTKPHITKAASWVSSNLAPGTRILADYETLRLEYYTEKSGSGFHFRQYKPGRTRIESYDYALVRDPFGPLARQLVRRDADVVWRSGEGRNEVVALRLGTGSSSP